MLRLRERDRDAAANSCREALAAKEKLLSQIESLMQEHAAQQPLQASSILGQVDTQRLLESQRYQMHLLQQANHLRSQVQLVEAEYEKRRLRLVAKEQELRSLEKLKEKQEAEWQSLQLNRAQIALDQWAGFQYWKK